LTGNDDMDSVCHIGSITVASMNSCNLCDGFCMLQCNEIENLVA